MKNNVPDEFRVLISRYIEKLDLAQNLDDREHLIKLWSAHLEGELSRLILKEMERLHRV